MADFMDNGAVLALGLIGVAAAVQVATEGLGPAGPVLGSGARGVGSSSGAERVGAAWAAGTAAKADNIRTDGRTVWSYGLVIGETIDGEKVLYDYRGPHRVSLTTTTHVNHVAPSATRVVAPE